MTRLNLLEDQKVILTAQKQELENKRGDIYVREQQAISDALTPFFSEFPSDVNIEVIRGSVYFKMAHPECTYKKELFSLYLREDWSQDDNISFKGIDLSYYTTQVRGIDSWELRRLGLLGKLAEIVEDQQGVIVDAANQAKLPFRKEYAEVFKGLQEVAKEIRAVEELIREIQKEEKKAKIFSEGITFEKSKSIRLKFNYSPNVNSIKLVDVSKSGKKATAIFEFQSGHSSREENVDVVKVLEQLL